MEGLLESKTKTFREEQWRVYLNQKTKTFRGQRDLVTVVSARFIHGGPCRNTGKADVHEWLGIV